MGPGNLSQAELQALAAVPRMAQALERLASSLGIEPRPPGAVVLVVLDQADRDLLGAALDTPRDSERYEALHALLGQRLAAKAVQQAEQARTPTEG
jgi:hypothetical protein